MMRMQKVPGAPDILPAFPLESTQNKHGIAEKGWNRQEEKPAKRAKFI